VHSLEAYSLKGNHQIGKALAEKLDEMLRVKDVQTSIANRAVWKFALIHPHTQAHSSNSFTNCRDRNIDEAERLSHLASIARHVLSLRIIFASTFPNLEANIGEAVVMTPIAYSIPESCTFFRIP